MKANPQTITNSCRTLRRLGWLVLIPVLTSSIGVQASGPQISIESIGETNAMLSWQDQLDEYIVCRAEILEGPWIPCLESFTKGSNLCQMAVCITGECNYFRLAQGQRFEDNFEEGNLDGWVLLPENPLLLNYITVEATNGQLHIQGSPPAGISRRLMLTCTNLLLTDFSAQIDILGWDDSAGNQPVVGLLGRVDPRIVESPPVAYFYLGGATVAPTEYPGQSTLWTWKKAANYDGLASDITVFGPRMQPSTNYRLLLDVIDNAQKPMGYALLVDEDGDLIAENTATDNGNPLTQGMVGIYVHEQSQSGTVDFWLDNFVAVGTAP